MAFMTWLLPTSSSPAKSANVRATRIMRWKLRAERDNFPAGYPRLPALLLDTGLGIEFADAQSGVDFALPCVLFAAGGDDAFQNGRTAFARFLLHQFGGGQAGDFDGQIDAVEQRTGNFASVTRDTFGRAAAGFDGMPEITARTRVHGSDKLEFGGIDGLARRAEMWISPFSNGSRKTSKTLRSNSGNSSKNKTP